MSSKELPLTKAQVIAANYIYGALKAAEQRAAEQLGAVLEDLGVDPGLVGQASWHTNADGTGSVTIPEPAE